MHDEMNGKMPSIKAPLNALPLKVPFTKIRVYDVAPEYSGPITLARARPDCALLLREMSNSNLG